MGAEEEARSGRVGWNLLRWISHSFSTSGGTRSILLRIRIRRLEPPSAAAIWRSMDLERVDSGSRASRT